MSYANITPPEGGKVTIADGKLNVPDQPVIPFIEGDGIGPDIWKAAQHVFDSAIEKAYGGSRKIQWFEVFAGEKAFTRFDNWLPGDTLQAFRDYLVGIKGPLATPVGGGIRSLNVALRQELDLYTCQRPVRYFQGVGSPVCQPELVDMVIFRENTEDIYAGIEFAEGTEEIAKFKSFLQQEFPGRYKKIRFPDSVGIGLKPVSAEGTGRIVKAAIQYAIDQGRKSVTLVHKGNIMKFTEGAFRDWGYEVSKTEFGATEIDDGPWTQLSNGIIVKDVIADAFLQQILTRPREYEVIATLNLNGDYVSDALAAQVGGIGIAPGGNINYDTGHAIFEATHGTAPKYTGQDKVNPGSIILSGEMMLRYLGWKEAADFVIQGMKGSISKGRVTYDLARLMENPIELKCSEFGQSVVDHM